MWSKLLVLCLLVIFLSTQKITVASTVNGYYQRASNYKIAALAQFILKEFYFYNKI